MCGGNFDARQIYIVGAAYEFGAFLDRDDRKAGGSLQHHNRGSKLDADPGSMFRADRHDLERIGTSRGRLDGPRT